MINIKSVIEQLDEFYSKNDTVNAEAYLDFWISEAKSQNDDNALLSLANEGMGFYRKAGNAEKAVGFVRMTLELIDKLNISDTVPAATFFINCATVYTAFSRFSEALSLFKKAEGIYNSKLDPKNELFGSLYNNMATDLLALRRFEESEDYFGRALDIIRSIPNSEPEQAVTMLNLANLAEAELGIEDGWEKIENYLDKAYLLLETPGIPKNGNYAFVCSKCAPVFDYYGRFAYAQELSERSKNIYERN